MFSQSGSHIMTNLTEVMKSAFWCDWLDGLWESECRLGMLNCSIYPVYEYSKPGFGAAVAVGIRKLPAKL